VETATARASETRLFLSARRDPTALTVHADNAVNPVQGFNLAMLARLATVVRDDDGVEHVALSNGRQWLRIDVVSGSLLSGPVELHFINDSVLGLTYLAKSLSMLAFLTAHGRFPALPPKHRAFANHQIDLLRTHDALSADTSQRNVAVALFGAERVSADWNGHSDAMRSRIRRLCKSARAMATRGYKQLLWG
jgi:hypothetical protein